ncbi:MAG: phosphoglycerate kinase, partial [Rhodobacteraceae bacterium]
QANSTNCQIILPTDIVCAKSLEENIACRTYDSDNCPEDMMILDIGVKTQSYIKDVINKCKTLIWNGPLGAFEIKPFDESTLSIAKHVANNTKERKLRSVAGGGDTVSALKIASVENHLSYISTAGGAFLEWLEGKKLPGIESLKK